MYVVFERFEVDDGIEDVDNVDEDLGVLVGEMGNIGLFCKFKVDLKEFEWCIVYW